MTFLFNIASAKLGRNLWLGALHKYAVPRGQHDGSLRPYSRLSRPEPLLFLSSSSSLVLTRLSEPRSIPIIFQKIWWRRKSNPDLWICSQELWPLDHRGGEGFVIRTVVNRLQSEASVRVNQRLRGKKQTCHSFIISLLDCSTSIVQITSNFKSKASGFPVSSLFLPHHSCSV
jgi:hypothetical protein